MTQAQFDELKTKADAYDELTRVERAPVADGQDAARLEFLADQDAQIQSLTLNNGTKYRIGWPDTDEAQSEWFGSPREAIDTAIAAQQQEGKE